jgi:hypothetical protein
MTITFNKNISKQLLTSYTIKVTLIIHNNCLCCSKAETELVYTYKAISALAWTGLEGCRSWRLQNLKIIDTRGW